MNLYTVFAVGIAIGTVFGFLLAAAVLFAASTKYLLTVTK